MRSTLRHLVRSGLGRLGYRLIRVDAADGKGVGPSFDTSTPLPDAAVEYLRQDHPRLREFRQRYRAMELPMAGRSQWDEGFLLRELSLRYFRGDNAYVWQHRNVGGQFREKYFIYLRDLAARDPLDLLHKLDEDGLFGCWSLDYAGWPRVSRDLLDSINELYFLDRSIQLFSHPEWTVLDIGAGYGRLAHRAIGAVPGLTWLCADAIPESTFLCEFYMTYRDVHGAEVIPLDELELRLADRRIDLAVNVHSFSEMSESAIAGWLDLLVRHRIPRLFIVPNDADRLLTTESDRRRRSFDHLLTKRGYHRTASEPIFADPAVADVMDIANHFLLFERESAAP